MTRTIEYNPADFPPGLVGISAVDWMWSSCAFAFMQMMHALPGGSGVELGRRSQSPAANRNSLIESFLKTDYQWICFIDSDMLPQPPSVLRLLSHNLDVVGAEYFMRTPPFKPCWRELQGKQWNPESQEPCEVEFVGTGMLLVRRNVIEAIPFPHFEHPIPGYGEDRLFCDKARLKGFKIFVDHGLSVEHLTTMPVTRNHAIAYLNSQEGQAMYRRPAHPARWRETNDMKRAEALTALEAPKFDSNGVALPAAAQ